MKRSTTTPSNTLALLVAIVVGGFGCAAGFSVQIDSIAAQHQGRGSAYVFFPAREGVTANDLQYQEFAGYAERALRIRGFELVSSFEEADIAILLDYGIGEPQTITRTFSFPIYGRTGGGTSTYSGSTYGPGGYSRTTGTVYQKPTYGVVGSQTQTRSVTTYFRYLILEAVDLEAYRESESIVPVWRTTVTSTGTSGDLRLVLPVLVGAAADHFGTNTGQQITIELRESDTRVLRIKDE